MDLADGPISYDVPRTVMGLPLSARLRVFRSLSRVSALRLRESSGCTSSGCSPCVPCTMQKREGVCHHLAPYGMRSAASLSRGELQREVAGLCRTCERRRARMGSRETPRAPPARVGHAHTHTGQGTSHVHVVPQSSRAGHHSVPGKWHDCLRRAHPPHPAHPASSAAHGCALKSPIPRGGAFLWGYPVESPVARSPIA